MVSIAVRVRSCSNEGKVSRLVLVNLPSSNPHALHTYMNKSIDTNGVCCADAVRMQCLYFYA